MLADTYEYQNLLFALKRKGLIDTGQYVVIGIDPSRMYNPSDPQIYVKGQHHFLTFCLNQRWQFIIVVIGEFKIGLSEWVC